MSSIWLPAERYRSGQGGRSGSSDFARRGWAD